jgi:hypothetical protein
LPMANVTVCHLYHLFIYTGKSHSLGPSAFVPGTKMRVAHSGLVLPICCCANTDSGCKPTRRVFYTLAARSEAVFGILKDQLGARRFLLRGLANVQAEFTILATAFNLRTLCRIWNRVRKTAQFGQEWQFRTLPSNALENALKFGCIPMMLAG